MKSPILVDAKSEIMVFSSPEKAEEYLEPIDVKNEEYVAAYDADGLLLSISVEKGRVRLQPLMGEPRRPDELERKLRSFMRQVGEPRGEDLTCSLSCLVGVCQKYIV